MKRVEGMLMLGSAGRNSGKTEFACKLIRRLAPQQEIIGIKVTTVSEKNGVCPRGGSDASNGCGVCSSFAGKYFITEETDITLAKDTSRLLAAGANKVLWLRVLKDYLAEGLSALIEQVGPGKISICESNSLRREAEPDLFLMMKMNDSDEIKDKIKASAARVMEYADRTIISDGKDFDLSPDQITIKGGRWEI